jgi:hypothetical protein
MAKSVLDAVLDAAHNEVRNTGNAMHACSQAPTTYAEAVNAPGAATPGFSLGSVPLAAADYTILDAPAASGGGRRLTVGAKTVTGGTSGTATHIAIVDTVGLRLLRVTECTSVGITVGGAQDFKAFSFDIGDPV